MSGIGDGLGDLGSMLDPDDWEEYREALHRVADAAVDLLKDARSHHWRRLPEQQREAVLLGDAASGVPMAQVADELIRGIMPFGSGNTHPRFFGWVQGGGNAAGVLAELAAAVMNSNCGGRNHAAIAVERDVIDWSRRIFGLPEDASGILVTGTSQATVLALAAARQRALGDDSRRTGLHGHPPLVVYAAAGVHAAVAKATELVGIGSANLRLVPIDPQTGAMAVERLALMVAEDRERGMRPCCVVGTAGSVDRGAFDPLSAIAEVCRREGLWFHVDGAFGAWLRIASPDLRRLVDGIDCADSLACDFHKWMFVPYDCGMLLMRDEAGHRAAFATRPSYLASQGDGIAGGEPWYCDYGIDLSRGFRALKVWATLRAYGVDRIGEVITGNCRLANRLATLVEVSPALRCQARVISNVCCFGIDAPSLDASERGRINAAVVRHLQSTGEIVLSTTSIEGMTVMRAAITNHRTTESDIEATVGAVERLVEEAMSSPPA